MSRLIPAAERIIRARALIQKARDLPVSVDGGWQDFAYVAEVKDLLRQARDMIKFISYSVGSTAEVKKEVANLFAEADLTEKELLHK
ncbi:MAG: hypothetical protein IH586_15340 [Anaerolineaceae bacterium]|nr:hypothetical protein [Anaerolineaceae bacterium]